MSESYLRKKKRRQSELEKLIAENGLSNEMLNRYREDWELADQGFEKRNLLFKYWVCFAALRVTGKVVDSESNKLSYNKAAIAIHEVLNNFFKRIIETKFSSFVSEWEDLYQTYFHEEVLLPKKSWLKAALTEGINSSYMRRGIRYFLLSEVEKRTAKKRAGEKRAGEIVLVSMDSLESHEMDCISLNQSALSDPVLGPALSGRLSFTEEDFLSYVSAAPEKTRSVIHDVFRYAKRISAEIGLDELDGIIPIIWFAKKHPELDPKIAAFCLRYLPTGKPLTWEEIGDLLQVSKNTAANWCEEIEKYLRDAIGQSIGSSETL